VTIFTKRSNHSQFSFRQTRATNQREKRPFRCKVEQPEEQWAHSVGANIIIGPQMHLEVAFLTIECDGATRHFLSFIGSPIVKCANKKKVHCSSPAAEKARVTLQTTSGFIFISDATADEFPAWRRKNTTAKRKWLIVRDGKLFTCMRGVRGQGVCPLFSRGDNPRINHRAR